MWNDRLFKVKTSFTAGSGNGKKLNRGGGSSPNCFSHRPNRWSGYLSGRSSCLETSDSETQQP